VVVEWRQRRQSWGVYLYQVGDGNPQDRCGEVVSRALCRSARMDGKGMVELCGSVPVSGRDEECIVW
jgi:hypothetical protein